MAEPDAGPATAEAPPDLITRLTRGLAVAGGILLLSASFMLTVSVLLRWLRNDGLRGDFEMVQIATAVAVFAFLPLCQKRRGNVFVDTFTLRAPAWFNRGLDVTWDLVYALAAGLITWRLMLGAYDAISSRTTSMVLGFPVGWAIMVSAMLAGFLCLVTLYTAWRLVRRPS